MDGPNSQDAAGATRRRVSIQTGQCVAISNSTYIARGSIARKKTKELRPAMDEVTGIISRRSTSNVAARRIVWAQLAVDPREYQESGKTLKLGVRFTRLVCVTLLACAGLASCGGADSSDRTVADSNSSALTDGEKVHAQALAPAAFPVVSSADGRYLS